MRQGGSAASLPRVTPYRDYLSFIAAQDHAASLRPGAMRWPGWRRARGLRRAQRPRHRSSRTGWSCRSMRSSLGRWAGSAREHALTLNTLVQTAFGVLLGRLSGPRRRGVRGDGCGAAGRACGAERMVGLFINTLPLRMQLPPELPLSELLRRTQGQQSALMAHQHVGLAEIQRAAGLGDLFDTLVVFENYPVDRAALSQPANGLRLGHVEGRDATHYPLALIVQPGETLQLRLDYRADLFDRETSRDLVGGLCGCLRKRLRTRGGRWAAVDPRCRRSASRSCEGFNATARELAPSTLPALFAAQAAAHARGHRGGVRGPRAQLRRARRPCQPPGRIICEAWGSGPRRWWGSASSARPRWWSACSASSRPAAAYLPLDPNYPHERSASCCRTPAPRCW